MTRRLSLLTATTAAAVMGSAAHAATIGSVATYDENVNQPNAVNTTAAGSNISLSDFTAAVAAAFANDTGGVANFDGDNFFVSPSDTLDITYGTSGSETLVTSFNSPNNNPLLSRSGSPSNGAVSISNGSVLQANVQDFTLGFATPLQAVGFTALSRQAGQPRTINLTVNLTDDGNAATADTFVFPAEVVAAINAAGARDDTFFGYEAPTGRSIASIFIDNSGPAFYDDLGFITVVPEPASLGLIGVGTLLILGRRRRTA